VQAVTQRKCDGPGAPSPATRSMIFETLNTTYTLVDKGDGAFLIQGNDPYCPEPTLVRLLTPVEVGRAVAWEYVDKRPFADCKPFVFTSRVKRIVVPS
jgi:hypothetical protein